MKILSKEHKEKLRQAKLKNPVKFWKGKKFSLKHKKNLSIAAKKLPDLKGEKNHAWKGGLTTNREHILKRRKISELKRRAIKLALISSFTLGEWELLKKQYNFTCPSCKKREPDIKLTVDHIIPLIKGGSNVIENIQPLCNSCNSKKHTKIIRYEII